jgi:hypothetical protein
VIPATHLRIDTHVLFAGFMLPDVVLRRVWRVVESLQPATILPQPSIAGTRGRLPLVEWRLI